MKNIENITGSAPCADPAVIAQFFREITREWHKYPDQVGVFEIRCLGENQRTVSRLFAPSAIDDAVAWAVRMNKTKLNIYATINPVDSNTSGSARFALLQTRSLYPEREQLTRQALKPPMLVSRC